MNTTFGGAALELNVSSAFDCRYSLVCGDSQTVLRSLPEKTFASVVTSPPYWGLRCYGTEGEIGSEDTLDEYLSSLVSVFREVHRVLRDDGVLWLVVGDAYTSGHRRYRAEDKKFGPRGMKIRPRTPTGLKPKELIGLPWRLAFALQDDGWFLRTDVVWAKPNPLPESVKDRPHRSHEFVFMMTKSLNYFFDRDYFEHPSLSHGRFGRSVWSVSVGRRKTGHPAAFPIELITPCVISSSRPGDLVLDPFCGSGSVGLSCLRVGRRFVGIEVVPAFVDQARISLDQLSEQHRVRLI